MSSASCAATQVARAAHAVHDKKGARSLKRKRMQNRGPRDRLSNATGSNVHVANARRKKQHYVPDTSDSSVLYCDGGFNALTRPCAWGSVVYYDGGVKRDALLEFQDVLKLVDQKDITNEPGLVEWAIKDLPDGRRRVVVCKFDDVPTQQNNGAELIAFDLACQLALKYPLRFKQIACDSQLVVEFWSLNCVNAVTRENMIQRAPLKHEYIVQCAVKRGLLEKSGCVIQKIPGSGNPADLGFH